MVMIPDEWLLKFFEVLETYNFTIDENTSFDEELSIDPEMLGRIFENLLAEINPETGETARKSTGSYYTPRVIVDYMVDESLLLYLKNQTQLDEDKLRSVISYNLHDNDDTSPTEDEKEHIINALEKVKILDPACGSGAFPIGALQKIVFILQQADPEGRLWFKKQIKNTPPELRRVVEREFAHKNFDYIRKLGIIRENIYGVDIQPIATEIARLRCFLTLVVDERIQEDLENRGIEPLPNLDFKFVTANSLIDLPEAQVTSQLGLFEDKAGIDELKELRDMFFNASGAEREQLKLQFVQAQNRMFQRLITDARKDHADLTIKLSTWDPFTHKSSSWFDPEWMFGIDQGFSIVIANPPYVRADNPDFKNQRDEIKKSGLYETLYEKWDLFLPFIERGLKLLGDEGLLCYITSNSLLTSKFGFRLLDYIQQNDVPQFIDYFSDDTKIFEAGVVPVVFGIARNIISKSVKKTFHVGTFNNIAQQEDIPLSDFRKLGRSAFKLDTSEYTLTGKTVELGDICYISVGMVLNADEKRAQGLFKVDDLISSVPTSINTKRYVEAKNIENWVVKRVRYLEWDTKRCPKLIRRKTFPELYDRPKLMVGSLTGGIYDDTGLLTHHGIVVFVRFIELRGVENKSINASITKFNSVTRSKLEIISQHFDLKYLLAILNSRFANEFLNSNRRHRLVNYFYPDDFRHLPIADITLQEQQPFINLVEKILELTGAEDYQRNPTKQARVKEYEKQIDQLVYKLYGLMEGEIQTVEEETSVRVATKSMLESSPPTELTEQHIIY
jgi:adenine-specific DNA-methyltransferase